MLTLSSWPADITEYGRLAIAHGAAKEGVEKTVGAMLKEIKDIVSHSYSERSTTGGY
jgi:hypothetical protein